MAVGTTASTKSTEAAPRTKPTTPDDIGNVFGTDNDPYLLKTTTQNALVRNLPRLNGDDNMGAVIALSVIGCILFIIAVGSLGVLLRKTRRKRGRNVDARPASRQHRPTLRHAAAKRLKNTDTSSRYASPEHADRPRNTPLVKQVTLKSQPTADTRDPEADTATELDDSPASSDETVASDGFSDAPTTDISLPSDQSSDDSFQAPSPASVNNIKISYVNPPPK